MKKNNNDNKTVIIVGILVLLLFSLILCLIIFKNNNKINSNNNNKPNTTNKKKEIDVDPENYSSVFLVSYHSFNNCNTGYIFDFNSNNKLELKDLSNDFIYNTIYNYLKIQNKISIIKQSGTDETNRLSETNYIEERITLNDFLYAYQTIYGTQINNIKYEKLFYIGDYKFELNDENIYYSKKTVSPNCVKNNRVNYTLKTKNITEEKIELTYIVFYTIYKYENDNVKAYATNKKDGNIICDSLKVTDNDNIGNFQQYKFTFTKKDNIYIFNNITLVK